MVKIIFISNDPFKVSAAIFGGFGTIPVISFDCLTFDVELEAVFALDSVGLDQVLPVELDHLLFELGLAHRRGDATLLVSLEANRVLLL